MVSVRKRKMNRSSVKKATRKRKDKQREFNISSNPIIAANWDKNLTLSQNYARLGLKVRLGKSTGGVEKELVFNDKLADKKQEQLPEDEDTDDPARIPKGRAKIVRDEEGNVLKVVYGEMEGDGIESSAEEKTEVVKQLEALSKISHKKERHQSERETEWIAALVAKHGDDYDKMMWDKKLNPFQHSKGELKKRIFKWKKAQQ
ncbi:unnamed protein product [Kuraishia capsulata CBS 1993]|uniref:Nucleolar protein 16 n=1 Tax=Kuraishia capsulata CBS 1993 TaxID=1382522 RepID=W6MHR9_9ASCO|nr:uncharacterized protein KUCA_T00001845001 [Kuraishia capsulata CBS 1993]CDK25874.1 unnamed protein product [Kuraishia capsulata CBS 1993]